MAFIYDVALSPSKVDVLLPWLPGQPWARGVSAPEQIAAYRFDDPAGEVGVETLLLRDGETLLQVPLAYRGEPVAELEEYLIGTIDHPVLGQRWVYDAVADPVYLAAIGDAVLTGAGQAEQFHEVDDEIVRIEPTLTLEWSAGDHGRAPAVAGTDVVELDTPREPVLLFRRPDPRADVLGRDALLAVVGDLRLQLAAAGQARRK
ncbi:hypothetical protein E8P82_12065 [Arthrobacter echini]|uniref:Maltokinase N-terminal cap domain-containing protein n=1 Tax=Arthrobacter echini TaxID=1529066 RepID=A0A4S5E263_9MICC|nr:hypothetical protein [Arthrobacter echini]THJ65481.1 hypothetical protein E8P82_12065 [Arthrobacter echini]